MSGESSAHEQIKRAQALIDLGRQEQAVELLAAIPQTTPLLVAAVNCFLAYAFAGLGKKDEAYACARRALEAEPNNDTALFWLAIVEPDDATALQHTSRLIELDPDWVPYQSLHAISLLRNGRKEEAEAVAREAARQAPEDVYVLGNLGDVLHDKRSPEAEQVYARILEMEPDDLHARKALARIKQKDEADESAPSATDGASPEPDDSMEASAAMRTSAFFALAAFSGLITLNQTIYQYLAGYAQSFAQTLPAVAAASGIVASAAMAGQAIGKVLLGVVNDRSVKLGAVMGIGAGVAGVTLMWLLPGQLALLLVGAFLFGIAYAETTVQTPLLVRTVFGSADYTNVYSCVSMVGSLMGTFAAVFWSLVVDSAGGYPLMFALGYVCMVGCLALALFSLHWKARRNAT